MKLGQKLFISHVAAIAVGVAVLGTALALVAPFNFNQSMQRAMGGPGPQAGAGKGMMMHGGEDTESDSDMMAGFAGEVQGYFRRAIYSALVIAGIAAVGVASVASWTISQRITRPVREMAQASHHIAEGHYEERLVSYDAADELGELTASFNQMAGRLAAAEQLRRQLIADVAHELKTPLASIKGYMEGLQDGVIEATPETFQLVHREAGRLQHLVDDLHQLAQAEAAQLRLNIQPCDAAELVRAAADFLRPQYADKGVGLAVELPDEPVRVRADFDRIRQVLLNVIGNALWYTPSGGSVTVRLTRQDGMAAFAVQDTGIGLAPEDVERVFERFYRVDRSRSRASGGSGIGLTIAKHIVEEHGGRIRAESAGHDQGSTFTFTLPVA